MSKTVAFLQSVGDGILCFSNFELDVATGELRREGRLIHLRPQAVGVLRLLLEKSGGLVTRQEITSVLWPDDVDVDVEQGLNHCMKEVRAAIGDRPDSPRFIQTLPRRGYRFLGGVYRRIPAATAARPESQAPLPSAAPRLAAPRLRVHVIVSDTSGSTRPWSATWERWASEAAALEGEVLDHLRAGIRSALESSAPADADGTDGDTPPGDPRFE